MSYFRKRLTGTSYCGPGGSGAVLNGVDAACKAHDEAYKAPYMYDYYKSQAADKLLLQRLSRTNPRGIRPRITKAIASGYFGIKTKLHDMADGILVNQEGALMPVPGFKRRKPTVSWQAIAYPKARDVPRLAGPQYRRVARAPAPYYRSRRFYGKTRKPTFSRFRFQNPKWKRLANAYRRRNR